VVVNVRAVRVVQVPGVEVIGVTVVDNGLVPALRAMHVSMTGGVFVVRARDTEQGDEGESGVSFFHKFSFSFA
jgi:hypothetical protein